MHLSTTGESQEKEGGAQYPWPAFLTRPGAEPAESSRTLAPDALRHASGAGRDIVRLVKVICKDCTWVVGQA